MSGDRSRDRASASRRTSTTPVLGTSVSEDGRGRAAGCGGCGDRAAPARAATLRMGAPAREGPLGLRWPTGAALAASVLCACACVSRDGATARMARGVAVGGAGAAGAAAALRVRVAAAYGVPA